MPPIQVNTLKTIVNHQDIIFIDDRLADELTLFVVKGKTYKTAIDNTNLTTPPNLFGIERRIA